MQYVVGSAKLQLQKGDSVVTAGETLPATNDRSPYPPGLLIGEVVSVTTDPNAVVHNADIQPAAHLSDATFVLIITNYQGGFGPPAPERRPERIGVAVGFCPGRARRPGPTAQPIQPAPSY